MDMHSRRNLIDVLDNPDVRADFLVSVSDARGLSGIAAQVTFSLRYVPDRHVLDTVSWGRYLDSIAGIGLGSMEEAATTALSDFCDVVIPRWCALEVSAELPGSGRQKVTAVDRQPDWNDKEGLIMLDRLGGEAE